MIDENGEIPHWDVGRNTRQWLREHVAQYQCRFSQEPIINHMSQWPAWADKFADSEDPEKRRLALMLMYSLKDKEECLEKYRKTSARYTALFFAFIETVDRLPAWARWAVRAPRVEDSAAGLGGAWKSVQQINEWRAKNKLNIREWDDA